MPTRTISQTIDLTNKPINKYITEITNKGIIIHPEDTSDTHEILINSTGIDLKIGAKILAHYGSDIILGNSSNNLTLTPTQLTFFLNQRNMANFGYNLLYESYGLTAENIMITGAGNALRLDNGLKGSYQGQFILETRSNGHLSLKPGLIHTEEEE